MLKKNPETYNEIVHYRKMMDLAKYYQMSEEVLNEISDFILADEKNTVVCRGSRIDLKQGNTIYKTYSSNIIDSSIDGLTLSLASLVVIPHYVRTSGGGGGYSGGGSSNNNNNNNNNNN